MSTHTDPKYFNWETDPADIRRAIVREMNRLGAIRLEGDYSGGHDEGGLQTLTLFDRKGNVIAYEATPDALWYAIDGLLSTKFYTWALEGYVHGQVFVDLKEKRAWTEGEEEVTTYHPDSDPIDMSW